MNTDANLPQTQLAVELLDAREKMGTIFPGYRRAFARGYCCDAVFTPSGDASAYTSAEHLQHDAVRATVRFADVSGNPNLSDARTSVRGLSVKFHLAKETTDLLSVDFDRFTAATPEAFLDQMRAFKPDPSTGKPNPESVDSYLGGCPMAAPILADASKNPTPASFATTRYFAINAFMWRSPSGHLRPIRYRWEPDAGCDYIPGDNFDAMSPTFLSEELQERLQSSPVSFSLKVQFGEKGDVTNDSTEVWPSTREEIDAGKLVINRFSEDQYFWNSQSFDPTNLTEGIELSDDPVLSARGRIYAVSYDRRSHAR